MVKSGGGGGSVVLERPFKLWSLILDSVRCGGGREGNNNIKKKKQQQHCVGGRSEKLSELLKQPGWWDNDQEEEEKEEVVRKKEQVLDELKCVASKLQMGAVEGAAEVRRLTKDDPEARTTLALLGVIPPLVALIDDQDPSFGSQIAALYALLNLAIANDANKAAIVKAGAIHKMLKLIQSPNGQPNHAIAEAVVANLLGLSALDSNKEIIGSSGAIPFLVETLRDTVTSHQAKQDSIRALYNLSISKTNVYEILETDLIPHLLSRLGDMDVSERILSILSNVVMVAEGRRGISTVPDALPVLVDVLNWTDSKECQEKACYILMVMAHKSYVDRQAMIEAGIVSSLLELTLLGTTLAQKRASRMLECLRVDKGKQVSGHSGDGSSTAAMSAPLSTVLAVDHNKETDKSVEEDEMMMSQEKKAVKQLVQQSLQNNMKRMVKRANLPLDFVPSDHFKSLTSSSTSKSLPF